MPHAKQLAYKKLHDPLHFNLSAWLLIGDPELRAPNRVTEQEIDEWTAEISRSEPRPSRSRSV